jgi:carboxylesterase family protein
VEAAAGRHAERPFQVDSEMYSFEREADAVIPDLVTHGLDRNFLFGNNFGPPSNYVLNPEDLALFHAISGYWTRFAATGNPNDSSAIHWSEFKHPNGSGRGPGKHITLDWPVREGDRLRENECELLGRVLPRFDRGIACNQAVDGANVKETAECLDPKADPEPWMYDSR